VIGRDENHLFYVYEIHTEDDISFGPEVVVIQRFTVAELCQLDHEASPMLGNAYYFVAEKWYPELLPQTYVRRFLG